MQLQGMHCKACNLYHLRIDEPRLWQAMLPSGRSHTFPPPPPHTLIPAFPSWMNVESCGWMSMATRKLSIAASYCFKYIRHMPCERHHIISKRHENCRSLRCIASSTLLRNMPCRRTARGTCHQDSWTNLAMHTDSTRQCSMGVGDATWALGASQLMECPKVVRALPCCA